MLLLFETPAGYSLFKVKNKARLSKTSAEDIHDQFFTDAKSATDALQCVSFQPFADTAQAVQAATAIMEGSVTPTLQSFLKKQIKQQQKDDSSAETIRLAVADKTLANSIKNIASSNKLWTVVHDEKSQELFRGIRCYMEDYFQEGVQDLKKKKKAVSLSASDLRAMQLGLSHSLSRYKLKFSADKVDTMVIQAIGLLDELDKEINTYAMRVKEWYGWHFPELQGLVNDNVAYSQLVLKCGVRTHFRETEDLSAILPDESQSAAIKEAAEISMGTEIAPLDILNIQSLAEQVISLTEYRSQLFEYLKHRMNAIAPNLTILVGELVGARLISHAGSLMNLAKQPASTVQILGAEKALFRALKTKHNTPKYGLIYHASLIGQAAPKHKGKISRVLAAKAALAIRVDALSDDQPSSSGHDEVDLTIGYEGRAKVEARLRQLEGGSGAVVKSPSASLTAAKTAKYDAVAARTAASTPMYNTASDVVLEKPIIRKESARKTENGDGAAVQADTDKKRKARDEETPKEKKKAKKEKKEKKEQTTTDTPSNSKDRAMSKSDDGESEKKKQKKEKRKSDISQDNDDDAAEKAANKAKKSAKKEKRKSNDK